MATENDETRKRNGDRPSRGAEALDGYLRQSELTERAAMAAQERTAALAQKENEKEKEEPESTPEIEGYAYEFSIVRAIAEEYDARAEERELSR